MENISVYKVFRKLNIQIFVFYLKMTFFLFKLLVLSYLNLFNCNRVITICRD